jgi:AcrR family transcriptional regulator
MNAETQTQDHILRAAWELLMTQGIKKTSMDEIAQHAGLTRITVYRYYADKEALVRAAFLHSEQVFEQARRDLDQYPDRSLEDHLERIGRALAALPPGNPAARADELRRLYPDLYAEYQQQRLEIEGDLFDRLLTLAGQTGQLRPGLNLDLTRIIFWETLKNLFENPQLQALGLSDAELFSAVIDLFCHGIAPPGG